MEEYASLKLENINQENSNKKGIIFSRFDNILIYIFNFIDKIIILLKNIILQIEEKKREEKSYYFFTGGEPRNILPY